MVKLDISTLRLMLHLRAVEKLGGVSGGMMLFPTTTLHHFERQKQKEKSEAEIKYHRASIHHPARKVLHVFGQPQMGEELGLPARLRGEGSGNVAQKEQGDPRGNADDSSDDLAARDCRGQASEGD